MFSIRTQLQTPQTTSLLQRNRHWQHLLFSPSWYQSQKVLHGKRISPRTQSPGIRLNRNPSPQLKVIAPKPITNSNQSNRHVGNTLNAIISLLRASLSKSVWQSEGEIAQVGKARASLRFGILLEEGVIKIRSGQNAKKLDRGIFGGTQGSFKGNISVKTCRKVDWCN